MEQLLSGKIDTVFVNCSLATMKNARLSVIHNGALAVKDKTIAWVGEQDHLEKILQIEKIRPAQTIDCKNNWILPGFVDGHTHLVWAGTRADEFEMRLKGIPYETIARKGGGIFSTVLATRKASVDELFQVSSKRLAALMDQGMTTIEIKSGYGLDTKTELKILQVIKLLDQSFPVHIEATFLGAHALPPEFKNDPNGYIDLVTQTMLPEISGQKLATAVDAFCEKIAFAPGQTKQVFQKAKELGFNIKLHAEQLSDSGGAALASEFNALSCDHLEYLSKAGAKKMADHRVTAVLLPGAFYYLRQTQKPPVRILRDLNIPMALATDLNPGSSPVFSMPLILNLACNLFSMTCEEALAGATLNSAKALRLDHKKGSLEPGKDADLVVWDINSPIDLCYMTGIHPVKNIMIQGRIVK